MILFMLHRRAYASACADACAHAWTILCCEVERMILTSDPNKRIVLVLNKIDLVRPSPRGRQRAICKCQPTQTYTHTCATGNVHWSVIHATYDVPHCRRSARRRPPPGSASAAAAKYTRILFRTRFMSALVLGSISHAKATAR